MNKDDKKATNSSDKEQQEVKFSDQTPIHIDDFTLGDIFDRETINKGIKTLFKFLDQLVENEKAKNELARKQIEKDMELSKLDLEKQKLNIQAEYQRQRHIKWFDIRNKIYTVGILILVIVASVILKNYDLLDKSEARIIIVMALSIGMTNNTELINKLFRSKRND